MSAPLSDLTAEHVRSLFVYGDDGALRWRESPRGNVKPLAIAGSPQRDGYLSVSINRRLYLAHRLIWLYVYGEWPKKQIDHIDGIRTNNAIKNLRDVTNKVNSQNEKKARKNHKSCGLLGVKRNGNNWQTNIGIDGRQIYIGTFKTPEQAHAAYLKAKRQLHEGCTI